MSFNRIPEQPNWRNESDLSHATEYRRRYALWPRTCSDGTQVWLAYYYKKYEHWTSRYDMQRHGHTDYIESITEAEYIVRKLSENL
jgi:hypothetical protein